MLMGHGGSRRASQRFRVYARNFTREGFASVGLPRVPPGIFAGWNQEETEMQTQLHLVPPGMLAGWNQEETEMQTQLHLVGLAVMVNPLKPCSAGVIKQLQDAGIRTPMVTIDGSDPSSNEPPFILSIISPEGNTRDTTPQQAAIDGSDPSSNEPPFILSIISPDGNTRDTTPQQAAVLIMTGEIECAVTGKGFNSLEETLDRGLLTAALRHATEYTCMSIPLTPFPPLSSTLLPGRLQETLDRDLLPAAYLHATELQETLDRDLLPAAYLHATEYACMRIPPTPFPPLSSTLLPGRLQETLDRDLLPAALPHATELQETLDRDLLPAALRHATVYARMSPDNKRDLMQFLGNGLDGVEGCPHLGLWVGFCGDGANDCGALKAAHVGVSLCEAEASVAAPMTSKHQSIESMITVISEGRCTLMATYQIFQFIIGYALVQAFMTNLMYTHALNVGNYQYLIQDLFFTTVSAGLMGYTVPRATLSNKKPVKRVMSVPIMTSTVLQLLVVVVFQFIALYMLRQQPDYVRTEGDKELHLVKTPENTTLYLVALAQYVILALVFNKGKPHRSPMVTNYALFISLLIQFGFVLYSLFSIDPFNSKVQELVNEDPPMTLDFRAALLGLMCINMAAASLAEALSGVAVRLVNCIFPPTPPPLIHGDFLPRLAPSHKSYSAPRSAPAQARDEDVTTSPKVTTRLNPHASFSLE
eukprot:gene17927-24321_t